MQECTGQIEQLEVWSNGKVKEVGSHPGVGIKVCSEEGHPACPGDVRGQERASAREDVYAQTPGQVSVGMKVGGREPPDRKQNV